MTPNPMFRPIEILLVEDSESDISLTEEAFKAGKVHNQLHVARDGMEGLAFLRREGAYAGAPRPDLVLLDLNLPKMDGREVLEEIRADQNLKSIPVVVLTTSKADEDILRMYELAANCYITKPVDWEQFICVVQSIEHFWLHVVTLPSGM